MNRLIILKGTLFSLCLSLVLVSCQSKKEIGELTGKTMGTIYSIKTDIASVELHKGIKDVLGNINGQLNNYASYSQISTYNTSDQKEISFVEQEQPMLRHMLEQSLDIYVTSDGYFDPSIQPLVGFWGFGAVPSDRSNPIDSLMIDSLVQTIGFDKINFRIENERLVITKPDKNYQLDFSAIAKGYGVDLVAAFLDEMGSDHYLVEIGGEVKTKGTNERDEKWLLGINTPAENASKNDFIEYVELSGKALATSGDYRNFYIKDGKKYSHIINPKTGYPDSQLLSASVVANDCATADAWATTFVVMGLDAAMKMVKELKNVQALFVHAGPDGQLITTSAGMEQHIKE